MSIIKKIKQITPSLRVKLFHSAAQMNYDRNSTAFKIQKYVSKYKSV